MNMNLKLYEAHHDHESKTSIQKRRKKKIFFRGVHNGFDHVSPKSSKTTTKISLKAED